MLFPRIRRLAHILRATPLHPQWFLRFKRPVTNLMNVTAGKVLDIGCADRWLESYVPKACEYIGLDYLATGKKLYGARPDVFGDASQLPFCDHAFDAVAMLEVLEHLQRPSQALSEISRVLKPGGQLLLTIPFLYPVHDAPHDFQRYTIHGLTREFDDAGLVIDEVVPALGSAETAAVISCVALAGMAMQSLENRSVSAILVPILLLAVPVVNLLGWLIGKLMPAWDATTIGYRVSAYKPPK